MTTELYDLVERNSYSLVSIMSSIPAVSLVIPAIYCGMISASPKAIYRSTDKSPLARLR